MSQTSAFKSSELGLAVMLAVLLEAGIILGLAVAGGSKSLAAEKAEVKELIPIQVTPVVDDLPMLKLGGPKAKLPDMWRKPPPKPRYEDKSAPSEQADKNLKELPKNEVAKANETPAPPSAEIAKKIDEEPVVPTQEPPKEMALPEEGANDGVKEGTETDPLKAFVVSQYRIKLISWFKSGFVIPPGTETDALTKIAAKVGADGTVTSFTINSPSGNEAFDARVKSHMDGKVGQQVPPPPPNYPNILDSVVLPNFSAKTSSCKNSKQPSAPNPAPAQEDLPPSSPPEE